jgi:TolB-like protein
MSPEQAMGEQDVDARSDIYSLGCVAYEMLAGDPPFTGTNPQAILARKTLESPPRLRTARDTVPESIEQTILKALAKVPADRFATAAQFRDALVFTPPSGTVVVAQPRQAARPRTIGLLASLAVAIAIGGWWISRGPTSDGIESLAVLPFYNATGDPDQEYLAAGMHDALINTLKQVGALKVTSLTSAMRFKNTEKPIPQIARELGVDAVVEASVRRSGNTVNLEVQLIDALPEERELWAQPFARSLDNVLVIYNEVARAIARETQTDLTLDQQARLGAARRVSQSGYEAYLRGMFLLRKGTVEDSQRGLAYLFEAIENDPADPLAYATLAMGYIVAAHGPEPPLDALPRARAAAERALSLDSTLAETLTALAFLKGYYEFQWDEAEQMFLRALEMKPSLDMAHYWYSWQLALFERMDEAWEEHILAQELDPLNPLHTAGIAVLYNMEERYDEAEAEARKALELDPQDGLALHALAEAHAARGWHNEAGAVGEQAGPRDRGWILGRQLALAGRTEEARAIAAELEPDGSDPWIALNLAILYTSLGDKDNAFRWLRVDRIHCWASWSRVTRAFEPLWDDPRFPALMEEKNLPWPTTAYTQSRSSNE